MQTQHEKNKLAYDKGKRDVHFEVGDRVLKRSHLQSSAVLAVTAKLAPKWLGPYLVREVRTPLTYKLSDVSTGVVLDGTHHMVDLKAYVEPSGEPDVWAEGEPSARVLRPRGVVQSRLRQAVRDLLKTTH